MTLMMPLTEREPRPRPSETGLRRRIADLEETLRAIQSGEVDALVVERRGIRKVFTLEGADSAFRHIVEQMSEAALTIRPEGTILYCNCRFAKLVGVPMEQIIGAPISRFAARDSREGIKKLILDGQSGLARTESAFMGQKRKRIPVLISLSPLKEYAVPALAVLVADLTTQKRQAQLATFTKELEKRVSARTEELSIANTELEAFSYSASHDLRGPLRSISGYGEMLSRRLSGKLGRKEAGYLRSIQNGVVRMGSIIDSLLSLSRASKGDRLAEPVDLTQTAKEIGQELAAASPGRKLKLGVEDGLTACGDPRLLRQLLQNLIGNAWKFTAKRSRALIEFKSARVRGQAVFCVKDNGIGFSMIYADKIFEPFQRLHSRDGYEGMGIGLALVQRIVVRHGGRIWAKSRVGHGAAFYFTLAPPSQESRHD